MPQENRKPTKLILGTTQQNTASSNDAEVIAYFEEQRKTARSDEWVACLDATIRQLRQS